MNFLTPAFVRVNNPEKRKELLKWMFDIGYAGRYRIDNTYSIIVAGLEGDCADVAPDTTIEGLTAYELINCGENIALFKALAAMNKNNWDEQYVIDNAGNIGLCNVIPDASGIQYRCITMMGLSFNIDNYRKATVEEIVEYFKNNEK